MKKAVSSSIAMLSMMGMSLTTYAWGPLPPNVVPHAAPEIDAAGAAIALGLVAGIVAIKRELRARKTR